jgi:hypothetical protein
LGKHRAAVADTNAESHTNSESNSNVDGYAFANTGFISFAERDVCVSHAESFDYSVSRHQPFLPPRKDRSYNAGNKTRIR